MITPALCFEGRDAELTQLSEDLATYGKVFVSGMGGVRKSELVRAFLVRNKGHFRSALHATYTTSLRDFYEQLQLVLETEGETAERIGWAYYNVALAKNYCNDRAGAIDYFEKALAQFESIQMDYAIANVYDSISECYFSLENYEKSQEYLFRALGLFRALDGELHNDTARTKYLIARNYRKLGQEEQAQQHHDEAVETIEKLGYEDVLQRWNEEYWQQA